MPDVFDKAKRSQVMAAIRGRGNKGTELALIAIMRRHGITGWRRNQPIFGRPDFVFRRERIAVFVDGCFWHCCPKHSNLPVNNRDFWRPKLESNRRRDKLVTAALRKAGWRVVRLWEHQLHRRDEAKLVRRLKTLLATRKGSLAGVE
jgi:DNA mismatch endonuclease (patch repair protein)